MEFKKSGKRMAKIKVTIISLFLLLNFNLTNAYEISDLIRILIDKNENSSSFKYDDLIDDIDLENATNIYIPQIDYSYSLTNNSTSANTTSTINSNTNTISATMNLYNGGFSQLNLLATQTRNQAYDYLRTYQKELLIKELINGYNNLQGLVLKKANQKNNIKFFEKKVQEAEILFKASRITKTDLLDFQNELIEAESLLLDYDRQIDNLMLQVNKLLDMELQDEDINFTFSISIPENSIKKKKNFLI